MCVRACVYTANLPCSNVSNSSQHEIHLNPAENCSHSRKKNLPSEITDLKC